MQGHRVWVVGVPKEEGERWRGGLPGVVGAGEAEKGSGKHGSGDGGKEEGKMKIAWRYERLGRSGEGSGTGTVGLKGRGMYFVFFCIARHCERKGETDT